MGYLMLSGKLKFFHFIRYVEKAERIEILKTNLPASYS